jgi:hypothetical protein
METGNVTHPGKLSLAGSGIVLGGVLLGTALAAFANPVPKPMAPPPWDPLLHPAIAAGDSAGYYPSGPEDLYPRNLPDGYAPAVAFTELNWRDIKLPPIPEYQPPRLPSLADNEAAQDAADYAAVAEQPVSVPHYAAIEQAANQAETTAEDVAAVQSAPSAPEAPPADGPKVIHVADALRDSAAG